MKTLNKSYQVQKTIGVILIAPSLTFLIFGIVAGIFMVDGIDVILGSLIISGAPLIIGTYLFLNARKKSIHDTAIMKERTTLELASSKGGILTQAFLAQNSDFSLAESGAILNDLTIKGVANVEVNEDGVVEYHFNSLK
jgi:hypothetical protein